MTESEATHVSKFLSLVLRHKPETIGISLDENGWADVTELLTQMARNGYSLTHDQLRVIVETNVKKRFAFNGDESRIRANQGHSVTVDLQYSQQLPPPFLYHGTATRFLDSIVAHGLKKMDRHHVHLSGDEQTAIAVGARHGKPVVLTIEAGKMAADGHVFYQSANSVWLVDHVPATYIVHG
jgi:putative RNA 2'-phosphotransferase